jgi:VanZ family protein
VSVSKTRAAHEPQALAFIRMAFWGLLVVTLAAALAPRFNQIEKAFPTGADKFEHAGAFFALMWLRATGWPGARRVYVAVALACLGVAIEALQATRFIGRDGDALDWAADTVGIMGALALTNLARRPRREIPHPELGRVMRPRRNYERVIFAQVRRDQCHLRSASQCPSGDESVHPPK